MFEQILKGALWFVVATYAVATFKTLTLTLGPDGDRNIGHVLVAEEGRKPLIYPVIDGSDTPMPFSRPMQTSSRVVGLSKVYSAVYPGMSVRDTQYRSFWR
ncbi:MAG: hypothetical protein ACR2IJ_01695 [Fluviibacter sp.]